MRRLIVVTAVVVGCGRNGATDKTCRPPTITVGGTPSAGLGHRLGYTDHDGRSVILMYSDDRMTCEHLLADDLPPGIAEERLELSTGAGFTGIEYSAPAATGFSVAPRNISRLVVAPARVGDPMAICAHASVQATTEVVIDGLFQAPYCGARAEVR